MTLIDYLQRLLPGIVLCVAITIAALVLQTIEVGLVGQPYLEALVLAILIGVAIRSAWRPGPRWIPGIEFSAKLLLEIAIVMLGASVSAATILALGPLADCRHRLHRRRGDRVQLSDLQRARPAAAHEHPDRLRQFDLRQFGDCRDCAGDRRRQRRRRVLDFVHRRARRRGRARPAAAGAGAAIVADAIRRARRLDGLCGAAGSRRDLADRRTEQPGRHRHQARAGADARAGRAGVFVCWPGDCGRLQLAPRLRSADRVCANSCRGSLSAFWSC